MWVNEIGFEDRNLHVHWQVSKVDLVNVSYTIRTIAAPIGQPKRCHHIKPYKCASISVHYNEFDCTVKLDDKYCDYNVSVIAKNSVGEVESDVVNFPFSVMRKYKIFMLMCFLYV